MCDPVSLSIGLAVVGTASTVGQQIAINKSAKAQQRAINEEFARVTEENRDAASAEMFDQAGL